MLVGGTGNIATGSPATERSSPRTDRGASSALASLEDGSEFDVDSVVDAIFANAGRAAPRTPVRGDRATGAEPEAPRRADPYEVLEPAPRLEVESSDDLSLDSDDLAGDAIPVPRSLPSGDSGTLPPERRDDDGARRSNRGASPWSADLSPAPEEARAEALRPPVRSSANVGRAEPPTVPPDAEAPDEPQLHPGSVIQDRYRIIEELGRGGMSIVYRAEHTLLLKEVALKLLRPELSTLRNVVERFQREARSVCRLDDPNIVRVTDFGRTGEGLLYLVMELIQGESLASIIKSEGRLPVRAAIGLVDQILAGLEQAHRFEIVHRDLKPENIMLVSREGGRQVKILDFGIAKLGGGDEGQKSITQAGTVFGTPRYMSPEQAAGEPVDHRTDLYTVGVILYQLLTGAVPFHGDTTVQLLAKVLTQDPPPMEFEAPHEGARLQIEAVTMKALAKEPEDRFSSARAFREALDGCLLF
jgi:tRNA A-37 threonylcarbamoyl transferase component Bud32